MDDPLLVYSEAFNSSYCSTHEKHLIDVNLATVYNEKLNVENLKDIPLLSTFNQSNKDSKLIRYRGFIKDVKDVEYYCNIFEHNGETNKYQSTKYRDIIDFSDIDYHEIASSTLQRLPVLCVPVPGENPWVMQYDNIENTNLNHRDHEVSSETNNMKRLSDTEYNQMLKKKRSCGESLSHFSDATDHSTSTVVNTDNSSCKNNYFQQQHLNHQITALLKLYDYEDVEDLIRLHHIIEVVGIFYPASHYLDEEGEGVVGESLFDVETLLNRSDGLCYQYDQEYSSSIYVSSGTDGGNQFASSLGNGNGSSNNNSTGHGKKSTIGIPRIHCISFRILCSSFPLLREILLIPAHTTVKSQTMERQFITYEKDKNYLLHNVSNLDSIPQSKITELFSNTSLSSSSSGFNVNEVRNYLITSLANVLNQDYLVAEYIALCVLSNVIGSGVGQRRRGGIDSPSPVGTLVLNICGMIPGDVRIREVEAVLREVLPRCLEISIHETMLTNSTFKSYKDYVSDDIIPSIFDVADGTLLIIDDTLLPTTTTTSTTASRNVINFKELQARQTLSQLISKQQSTVTFGNYDMNFPVNIPILIFSALPTDLGDAVEDVIRIDISKTMKGNDSKLSYFHSLENNDLLFNSNSNSSSNNNVGFGVDGELDVTDHGNKYNDNNDNEANHHHLFGNNNNTTMEVDPIKRREAAEVAEDGNSESRSDHIDNNNIGESVVEIATDQGEISLQKRTRLWWSICRLIEPQTADEVLVIAEEDFVQERQHDRTMTRKTLVNWLMVLRLLCKSFGELQVNSSHWRRMRLLENLRLKSLPVPATNDFLDVDINSTSFPHNITRSPNSVSCLI